MAKYVNVDTVHKSLKSLCNKYKISFGYHYGGFGEEIAKLTSQLPAVDVAPIKHGKWLKTSNPRHENEQFYMCSNCDWRCSCNDDLDYNYCPNCGAKMDLEVK